MSKKIKLGVDQDDLRKKREETSALNRAAAKVLRNQLVRNINPIPAAASAAAAAAADPEVVRANRMTLNLGVEIEPGEILSDDNNNNLLDRYICAVSQPRVLRQRDPTNRPTIVFPGQTIIPTEEITIPDITPLWLESVKNNINSLQSFIVNGIIPFELVRGINRLLNPRIQLQEGPSQVVDMPSLLQRIQLLAQEDDRRPEILSFAIVIDNYYTSLEAPARMEIGIPITRCEIKPCSSSQGDNPHAARKYGKKHTLKRIHFPMSPVNLCRTEKVFQEIVEMARLADNILRLYGTNATFAVWSPYGPGPSGLKRLFLIFEGVIEPTQMVARIAGEGAQLQAEIVTAFNIITGDNPITADATAIARVISTTTEAEVTHVGSRPEFISSSGAAVVAEERTELEIMPNLLNIPIRDAYLAWYAALWTQSSLNHESRVPQRTLQEHYATVEFTLGYIIGTRYNHIPTFYQFRLQRPIEDIMERCSRNSTWLCNLLGVDGEQRIEKNDPTLISGINYAASEWRQVANSSALFGSRVLREQGSRAASAAYDLGREYGPRAVTAAHDLGSRAASSTYELGREYGPRLATATTEFGSSVMESSHRALKPLSVRANAVVAVKSANQIQEEAESQLVGGGVRDNHIQVTLSPTNAIPALIELTIYPVVQLQEINIGGGGGSSEIIIPTQITTLDNATVIAELSKPEIAEQVTEQVTKQSQGRGIRGKKGMKRLTRKEMQRRETKKGKKGKGKGRKRGTKKRGKRRGTSNKSMPPTNTMRILKQKLKL